MAIYNYTVTAQGQGAYLINGNANPILTLQAGNTYNFIVNASGHPFWIKTDRVIGGDAAYNTGVTNNGAEVGTVTITLPADKTPPKLFYQCGKHIVMGGQLTKYEVPAESIANVIVDQLPDFVKSDHPKFQLFMEAYYEWLNQPGNPWNEAKSLLNYQDIDTTIDDFLLNLEKEYVALIPKNFDGDIRTLMKNIKQFYITKGSPKSYEFLFNILFNETIEFYYPKKDILRVSDGKWDSDITIKITNPEQYDVFELTGEIIKQEEYYFDTDEQRFMYRDIATATVERAVQFFLGGELVTELFLSKVTGTFRANDTYIDTTDTTAFRALDNDTKIYFIDANRNKHEYKVEPLLTGVTISDPGSGYEPNDVLPVVSANGDPGVNAIAQIKTVQSGPLTGLTIVSGGQNYKVGDVLIFDNDETSGTGAAGFVTQVDGTGTVANSGAITGVRLSSPGFGYKKLPTVSVSIIDPDSERTGLNIPTAPSILATGNNIGGIKEMQVINFGALYYSAPTIDFTTKGNGDAVGSAQTGGLARYPGSFSNDDGHLSAAKYLQDNRFYQEFSYVIRTGLSINAYRDTIKTLVHPAGMELFGEVFISSKVETGLYNNSTNDVNDTSLIDGLAVPKYIKLLQVFQSEFTQPYKQIILDPDGIARPLIESKHYHELEMMTEIEAQVSMGQYIRADLSWTDVYGVAHTEQRLLTVTGYVEETSLTGVLSDGATVNLTHVPGSTIRATPLESDPIISEDFTGTYSREFNDQDGTYTATVTVEARHRYERQGIIPKLQFPLVQVGNVKIDFSPEPYNSVDDPGTINMQPIRELHLRVPRIRAAFIGTDFAVNPGPKAKIVYIDLGIVNRHLISYGLTDQIGPHEREPFGFQIGNLTGYATIDQIEDDLIYKKYAGFTGTRPIKKGKITHIKQFELEVGIQSTSSKVATNVAPTVARSVEAEVSKVVVLQPYAGDIRPINDVLFTGYKYFTGTIGDTLDREIVDYFGRDIVPSRPVGANGGPSFGQISLQTFIDLGLNIQDFLNHEFGISEYFVYGANWQRSVELDLDPSRIDRSATDATEVIIIPIKVTVSAIETTVATTGDSKTVPVSTPLAVDNSFYSGNTKFGVKINSFEDSTIEEIENGVIRGYFTTVNPQTTVVYTRDNTNTITGTY